MRRWLWLSVLLALPLAASLLAQNEADIYREVSPSVVTIEVELSSSDAAGGAGFVIDQDGHIVTNAHVIDDARSLTVLFHDGYEAPATIIGTDRRVDLAVIRVDVARHRLKPVTFGDSDALVVGEAVMAIGSPHGLDATLTRGIISGMNRRLELDDGTMLEGAIQTDAMLAPGNSGGPLLNQAGEVIGVNTAGYFGTALGFAVPSKTARRVAETTIRSAGATATREASNTTDSHATANAMIATANAIKASAGERATEAADDDTASVETAAPPTDSREGGEGTFADPVKYGWWRGDGDGRWVGVESFTREINEVCRRTYARCKELKPGNEFIGVLVYAECEESQRTRCEFNSWEFEVAGKRGIPYSAESRFYFDAIEEFLLPEAVMPGGYLEGLVIFEVPRTDADFRFGWTPSFGWDTVWFAMLDYKALAATQAAEQRATVSARNTTIAVAATARQATAYSRATLVHAAINEKATAQSITQAATVTARSATSSARATEHFVTAWARVTEHSSTLDARSTQYAIATPTPTIVPSPTATPRYVTVDGEVNLRAGPGTNYAILGVARPGDAFAVIGYQAGSPYNWLQLRYAGGTAWIAESLTRARR